MQLFQSEEWRARCLEDLKTAKEATDNINAHPDFAALARACGHGCFEHVLHMGARYVDHSKTVYTITQKERGAYYQFPEIPPTLHLKMDTIKPTPQANFRWTAKDGKWVLSTPEIMVRAKICDTESAEA